MTDEKIHKVQKIHEKARQFRGRFLNSFAVVEHEVSMILTSYFCTEDDSKRELFFSEISTKLNFSARKKIIFKILQTDYPRYWNNNKETLQKIEELQTFRNKLAHSIIDVSDEAIMRPIEEGVGFIQWQSGKPIADEKFYEFDALASVILGHLRAVKELLPFKEQQDEQID